MTGGSLSKWGGFFLRGEGVDRDRDRVGIPARAVPLFFAGRARFCATLIGKNADNAQRHVDGSETPEFTRLGPAVRV